MNVPPADATPTLPSAKRRKYWLWIPLILLVPLLVYRFTYMTTLRVSSAVRAHALSGHDVPVEKGNVILVVTVDGVPDAATFGEGSIYFSHGGIKYGCFTTIVEIPGTAKLFAVFPRRVIAATAIPEDVVDWTLHLGTDIPSLTFKTTDAVLDQTDVLNDHK